MSVKHKAVSSTLWTFVRLFLDQIFSFLVFVVVARILGPADVGLFALGMIVVELGRIFATSGFGDAVTKASAQDEEQVSRAAFWGNMVLAVVSAIVIALAAEPTARFVNTPRLTDVVIALSFTIPVSAAYTVHQARQLKRFGYKSLAIRSLVAGVLGGAVAIAAAYQGAGVWSLVIQRGLTEIITLITICLSFRWWPGFRFSRERMKEIFAFSIHMSASKLGNLVTQRFQDIVIGAYISAAGVGIYRVAKRTNDMMMTSALTSFATVGLSLFAAVKDDEAKLRAAVIRVIAISATVAFPVFAGVAVVAPDLIPLIYGPKWVSAVPLLQLLTPVAVSALFSMLSLSILTIYGDARSASLITLVQLILTVILSVITVQYGIEAVILGYLARGYVMLPWQIGIVSRHVGCRRRTLLLAIARPLLAALIMSATCYIAMQHVQPWMPWVIARLAVIGLVGALVYIAVLVAIDRQSVVWLIDLAKGYRKPRVTQQ